MISFNCYFFYFAFLTLSSFLTIKAENIITESQHSASASHLFDSSTSKYSTHENSFLESKSSHLLLDSGSTRSTQTCRLRECEFIDKCSEITIYASPGGEFTDACGMTYGVTETCKVERLRCCAAVENCNRRSICANVKHDEVSTAIPNVEAFDYWSLDNRLQYEAFCKGVEEIIKKKGCDTALFSSNEKELNGYVRTLPVLIQGSLDIVEEGLEEYVDDANYEIYVEDGSILNEISEDIRVSNQNYSNSYSLDQSSVIENSSKEVIATRGHPRRVIIVTTVKFKKIRKSNIEKAKKRIRRVSIKKARSELSRYLDNRNIDSDVNIVDSTCSITDYSRTKEKGKHWGKVSCQAI